MAQGVPEQTSAHYKVTLEIGPVTTMLTLDQAASATEGEVMLPMPGMQMPAMHTNVQDPRANHHLEVHISDKATGAVVSTLVPMIMIVNQATGASQHLEPMAMYDVKEGTSDLHFGNNIFLPDGVYTVTVMVGNESLVFQNLTLKDEK
jgi:hypothetical protein